MKSHPDFLHAIRDRPDDDAPRLLYSDWLDEHGDPDQAEFLRTQVALARLPEDDERRPALLGREAYLLAHHAREWGRPVRDLARRWEFRRGCVEGVTLYAADFLAHGDDLFRRAPVRHLHLTDIPADLAPLATSPHWGPTRELTLHLRYAGWNRPAAVTGLLRTRSTQNLRGLRLRPVLPLASETFTALGALTDLESLDIPLAIASPATPIRWGSWPRLRRLRAQGQYDPLLVEPLAPQLEVLDLGSSDVTPARLLGLLEGRPPPPWQALLLNNPRLGTEPGRHSVTDLLRQLPPTLHRLELRRRGFAVGDARALARTPNLSRLTRLDVGFNPLGLDGMQALATSPYLGRLTHLGLAQQALAPADGPAWVARLDAPCLPRLAALDLRDNGLDARAAATLAGSALPQRLYHLDLRHNRLGDDGAWALFAADWPRLAFLDVRDNGLSPAAKTMLRQRFGYTVRY